MTRAAKEEGMCVPTELLVSLINFMTIENEYFMFLEFHFFIFLTGVETMVA